MNAFVWLFLGNLALAAPLALGAWLVGRYIRRPALTHGLWVLVLLKLVAPPLGIVSIPILDEPPAPRIVQTPKVVAVSAPRIARWAPARVDETVWNDVDIKSFFGVAEEPPVRERRSAIDSAATVNGTNSVAAAAVPWTDTLASHAFAGLLPTLAVIWMGGAVLVWIRALRKANQFQRLLRSASPASRSIRERVEQLAEKMGVESPQVLFVPGTISPLLWVWGRTASLVVPKDFFERLDVDMQTPLLVHELAHWRRGDHWVRRLECVAGGLYWWCPLVWWAQAGVRQAEEELCDAWVVATLPDSARVYALALVETVDFLAGASAALPPLASGLGPFSSLQRRLTMIFRSDIPRRLTFAGLLGLVGLGGLFLTWSPGPSTARAQDEERPRKKKDGAPREGEGRPDPKRPGGEVAPEDLNRLRAELLARQAELQEMQRVLQQKARELQALMEKTRGAEGGRPEVRPEGRPDGARPEGGRPDGKKPPGRPDEVRRNEDGKPPMPPRPEGPREGGPRPGARDGGPDVDRRIDELEHKIEIMIRELGNLRKDMSNRGPGPGPGNPGPRREGDGPPPPREGKDKDRPDGPFNRKGPKDGQPRPGARDGERGERLEIVPVPPRRIEESR